MTFHKYLVTFGMLVAGLSWAAAAESTPGNAPAASSASTSAGAPVKSTHHRKRHGGKTTEGAPGATNAAPASPTSPGSSPPLATATNTAGSKGVAASSGSAPTLAAKPETAAKGVSSTDSGQHSSRRRRHKGAAETASTTTNVAPTAAGAGLPALTPPASVSKRNVPSNSGKGSPPAPATGAAATAAASAVGVTPGVAAAPLAPSSHHHHGRNGAAATNAASANPGLGAPGTHGTAKPPGNPGSPANVTAPAGTSATSSALVAAAGTAPTGSAPAKSSRHHRHGKAGTPPPIIVTPSSTPLTAQAPAGAPLSGAPLPSHPLPTVSVTPTVLTGLPIGRPGAATTATLPINLGHGNSVALTKFPFTDFPASPPHRPSRTYPWKLNIKTTVFWIGEGGSAISATTNLASAWDIDWTHHNGGADDPDEMNYRSGYSSLTHASTLNPFYIALPFNDLAYPEKAERWLPSNWVRGQRRSGKLISACQGRWIEIKSRAGRVCYAQWEDVGPLVSDHAEYVFGPERPNTLTGAGLDVSPAVAKYLGIDSTAMTSWRFVDDDDVQPGMWLRYDEQALLFRALKEQMHPHATPRIQELSEPLPDGSAEDANEKRAGAARG